MKILNFIMMIIGYVVVIAFGRTAIIETIVSIKRKIWKKKWSKND